MLRPGDDPTTARFIQKLGADDCGLTPVVLPPGTPVLLMDDAGRASAARSIRRHDGSDAVMFRRSAWLTHAQRLRG